MEFFLAALEFYGKTTPFSLRLLFLCTDMQYMLPICAILVPNVHNYARCGWRISDNLPGEKFCAILRVNNEMPILAEVYKMLKVAS